MKELNIKLIKRLFDYDAESGALYWKVKLNRSIRVGNEAGTVNKYNKYRIVTIDNKKYRSHRIIWAYVYGVWPINDIDHINHDRADNRIENLREATQKENRRNMSLDVRNKSGFTGIYWNKKTKVWQAFIKLYEKNLYLGQFIDKFEAICARMSANNKYGFHVNHGRNLNA